MARCSSAGEDFVHFVFSPCVAVYPSPDVNDICLEANLNFTELLLPFSQLSKDVTIKDNNNIHTIAKLKINFLDAFSAPVPVHVSRSRLKEIVFACSSDYSMQTTTVSDGRLTARVPECAPWFEAWRYVFLKSLRPSLHEFLGYCLACIFVVSTAHPDPITALDMLNQQQQQQQQQQLPNDDSHPRWFTSNVAKFYVLLHSPAVGSDRSSETFAQMEKVFGAANCYLLTLFNQGDSSTTAKSELSINGSIPTVAGERRDSSISAIHTDPWLNHLLPHGYRSPVPPESSSTPYTSLHSQPPVSPDPLLVKSVGNHNVTDHLGILESVDANHEHPQELLIPPRLCQPHGKGLSAADLDCLRIFVYDFVVRCLLPWVEQTTRSLTEQTAHRMRLSRSFLSATKKFFTGAISTGSTTSSLNTAVNSSAQPSASASSTFLTSNTPLGLIGMLGSGGHMPASSSETVMARNSTASLREESHSAIATQSAPMVVYTSDAPEMQMRRLADLAFLFQQYEVAHQTYNVLKRDFQNDSASLYCAGAQEMSALSIFLQGTTSQRQYPHHYMDSAVTTYLQSYRAPELALRATLLNAEALCSRGLYAEAAMSLLRLTSVDDDLTSALLIEQTAYCMLRMRKPMLRKYAFRMALAAHRYNRARQAHLAIRSYKLAIPILTGRNWNLIEDHIDYNMAKQAYFIGDLAASVASLRQCLDRPNKQPADRQSLFVREYLIVLKKYLGERTRREGGTYNAFPEFPLPKLRLSEVKSMLGKPTRSSDDFPIEARGVQFSDTVDVEQSHCWRIDIRDKFPWWMEGTDVSDTECEDEQLEFSDVNTRLPWDELPKSLDHDFSLTPDHVSDRLEWLLQRSAVEPAVTTSSHKSLDLPLSHPLRVLHTRRSVRLQKPIAPIGEPITCQLPLSNPLRIPLVLHNLHLLWSFRPCSLRIPTDQIQQESSQSHHSHVISNETDLDVIVSRSARQLVSTETVPELIILPDENKTLEVSVVAKQKGELFVHGLCFDWNYQFSQSVVQAATEQLVAFGISDPVEANASDRLTKSSITVYESRSSAHESLMLDKNGFITGSWISKSPAKYSDSGTAVRGKITLSDFTPDETTHPCKLTEHLSPLAWTITNTAPLLKVSFSDLPSKLLQGQLFRLELTLSNIGTEPLSNVRLASNWPSSITFGSDGCCRNPDPNVIFKVCDSHSSSQYNWHSAQVVQPWVEVPCVEPHDFMAVLRPGSTVSIPMWFRAPHLSHSRRRLPVGRMRRRHAHTPTSIYGFSSTTQRRIVNFVFQYVAVNQNDDHSAFNHRFARHHHELELLPSLLFEAVAVPSCSTGVRNLLLFLRIRNQTTKLSKTTFHILQVSCGSQDWVLASPPLDSPGPVVVDPGETVVLYLHAVPSSYMLNNSENTSTSESAPYLGSRSLFSTVSYVTDETLEVTSSPYVDFYHRSGVNWILPSRQTSRTTNLDITLVVLWKARVATADPCEGTFYGQSHLRITRLRVSSLVPLDEHHSPNTLRIPPDPAGVIITSARSRLVRLRLLHPSRIVHSFQTQSSLPIGPSTSASSPLALNPSPNDAAIRTAVLDCGGQLTKCLAVITVQAELFNTTRVPVELVLEMSNTASTTCVNDSHASSAHSVGEMFNPVVSRRPDFNSAIPCAQWVGMTRQRLILAPNESRVLQLDARVPRPGVYRFDSLFLSAREHVSGNSEFVRQSTNTFWVLVDSDISSAGVDVQSISVNNSDYFLPETELHSV